MRHALPKTHIVITGPQVASGRTVMLTFALIVSLTGCTSSAPSEIDADELATANLIKTASELSPSVQPGLCLEPEGGKISNGTKVNLVQCSQATTQQWTVDAANGFIRLSGSMCLDVTDGVNRPGTVLQVWQCFKENTNQKFDISGKQIRWRNSDKCLDVSGSAAAGSKVQISACSDAAANQAWTVRSTVSESGTGSDTGGKLAGEAGNTGSGAVNEGPIDFGPNVLVFDAGMPMGTIQTKISDIYNKQRDNHFGPERYAYLFKPGNYNLDVKIGFGMTVAGLGASPDDVTINGAVRVKAEFLPNNNATQTFWRGAENLSIVPQQDNGNLIWAVSQATWFRRMHVKGNVNLSDNGWASGGFIADTKVDGTINSGTQQQFLTRNDAFGRWEGRNWNMVFVGTRGAARGEWPATPYSTIDSTPVIREKPYLAVANDGSYVVRYPKLKRGTQGTSWSDSSEAEGVLPISKFYIAKVNTDSADSINAALARGLHVIFTPGTYQLDKALNVTFPNTILLGMGVATLRATRGNALINVGDVDGVSLAGLMVDAGPTNSPYLVMVGENGSKADHANNPTALYDVSCRVGGAGDGRVTTCAIVNSKDVILDNTWLWRADHGGGAGWNANPSTTGIIVNGANVTAYGLFSEHFQGYQTIWNGENGATYMYQSEFPYDPPNQGSWSHDGVNGYASYKVGNSVTQHTAIGMGMYCVFHNNVRVENAIESPNVPGVSPKHLITVWLGVDGNSEVSHIINGWGAAARASSRESRSTW